MPSFAEVRDALVAKRKSLKLTQSDLARRSGVSLPTIKALEQGRTGELGFSKLIRLLTVLGMELKLQDAKLQRPTLEDLLGEQTDD